ncbi:hypothetical protein RvY_18021-1, partial [Ramazzottius varieornatus]
PPPMVLWRLSRKCVLCALLSCAMWMWETSAEPYQVSDIAYRNKQCYSCSTVVDEKHQVDTARAPADSKYCIAANRTLLSQNISICPLGQYCTVLFTRIGADSDVDTVLPADGFRYGVTRSCWLWTRESLSGYIAGGATENCSPRRAGTEPQTQRIKCYCETDLCNDWTYASLKQRFHDYESSLMPPTFSTEDYPSGPILSDFKLEAKRSRHTDEKSPILFLYNSAHSFVLCKRSGERVLLQMHDAVLPCGDCR